jgi:PAT family beta-lactamase induction signal transducer AmpG
MRQKLISIKLLPKELISIFFLSIVSAMPLVLISSTLIIWLARYGIERKTIAYFAAIGLPYSLKFLWAFIFDYFNIPKLSSAFGRYVSWLVVLAFGIGFGIYLLSFSNPLNDLLYMAIISCMVAFFSASFDIVLDAYRIKSLTDDQQGLGATAAIYGYRIGMLFASSGALILTETFTWQAVYSIFALVIFGITICSCLFISSNVGEGEFKLSSSTSLKEIYKGLIIQPFKNFMEKDKWVIILLFILLFKMSDAMLSGLISKFYVETGFSNKEIALVVNSFGFAMTMLGTVIGGYLTYKVGVMNFLKISVIIQACSNLAYLIIIYYGPNVKALFITISIENLSGAASTIGIVAYLSGLCDKKFAATQYALLSSLSSVGRVLFAVPTGHLVDMFGWGNFFIITTVLGLPAYFLVNLLKQPGKHKKNRD